MPLTPFHIGPILLFWALFLSLDIFALLLGATLMDIEGLLCLFDIYPVFHGVLHSILGATLVGIVASVFSYEIQIASNEESKRKLNTPNIIISGLLGAYSHIFLDAFLYDELNLAWPFDWWNPLLGIVDLPFILLFCIGSFVLGAFILIIRKVFSEKKEN